nr:ADAMTS-like protein 3 isoform X2 [Pongo abelii]XP_054388129.1 ADAMTS-like protein 3 isoform X2 [Pongo abelii]
MVPTPKSLGRQLEDKCMVTCGRGLRYRVVVCINHRGEHVGGCDPQLKLHVKEECVISILCYEPKEKSPVEAKLPWLKQAQELKESRIATEEPTCFRDLLWE